MDQIMSLIGNYAFPICVCVIMLFIMKGMSENHKAEMEKLSTDHKEQMKDLTEQMISMSTRQDTTVSGLANVISEHTKAINELRITMEARRE